LIVIYGVILRLLVLSPAAEVRPAVDRRLVVFVLLLGVPGFLGYLAHRVWPARLPCPHCGRPVPRDRPACFACGHDFPPRR